MNGRLYDLFTAIAERKVLGELRASLISPLRGSIVEVGAGTGASFPYYPSSARVLAVEPDPSMFKRAERRAPEAAADVKVMQASDTLLDELPEGSAEHIVATLVLCSVSDPSVTLRRLHRVLGANGTYVFVEHVRADRLTGRVQDALTPLWRRLSGNCHLNRDFEFALREAGFRIVRLHKRKLPFPIGYLLYGTAEKSTQSHIWAPTS